jgi:DNA-dependent RNA polymerase auxiliary subunit epsilon
MVMNFIHFFVDSLDLDLDFDLFPSDASREILDEETLRIETLQEVTDALIEDYEATTGDFDLSEELKTDEHAYGALVEAFYFCLNRRQGQPSDMDRNPDTKTANELRREMWWDKIRGHHAKALPHALKLDPIDCEEVFNYILVKTKERHGERCGWFLETDVAKTVGKLLEEYLSSCQGYL